MRISQIATFQLLLVCAMKLVATDLSFPVVGLTISTKTSFSYDERVGAYVSDSHKATLNFLVTKSISPDSFDLEKNTILVRKPGFVVYRTSNDRLPGSVQISLLIYGKRTNSMLQFSSATSEKDVVLDIAQAFEHYVQTDNRIEKHTLSFLPKIRDSRLSLSFMSDRQIVNVITAENGEAIVTVTRGKIDGNLGEEETLSIARNLFGSSPESLNIIKSEGSKNYYQIVASSNVGNKKVYTILQTWTINGAYYFCKVRSFESFSVDKIEGYLSKLFEKVES